MRLGVIPTLNPHSGGLYQYARAVMDALLMGWGAVSGRSVSVLGDPAELAAADTVIPGEWERLPLSPKWDPRHLRHALTRWGLAEPVAWAVRHVSRGRVLWQSGVGGKTPGWDRRNALDITLWTTARREIARFEGPMAVAFHDLQHRHHSRFPEFSAGGRATALEAQARLAASRAAIAIVESEAGREDLLEAYGALIDAERIRVLPYPAPPHISADNPAAQIAAVRRAYSLPDRYLFYPAQFWEHKNHEQIVRALSLLRDRGGSRPALVLSGSRRGRLRRRAFQALMTLARDLGVSSQLVVLDYVPDERMGGLYLGAAALVMPTFCGPSNIPILEAWATGCPVITSDIRGVREQAGSAALLVDPTSAEALASAIDSLWSDTELAARLTAAGRARVMEFSRERFAQQLRAALEDVREVGVRSSR